MQGSTSPSKNGESPNSGPQVLLSRTRPTALRARSLVGSSPRSRSSSRVSGWRSSADNVGATTPLAVGSLKVEEPGTPTLGGNPRPLGGNDLVGLVHEVAHDLPTDRRVRIKQPLHHCHRFNLTSTTRYGKTRSRD